MIHLLAARSFGRIIGIAIVLDPAWLLGDFTTS